MQVKPEQVESRMPALEMPEGREDPITRDELKRKMNDAERKARPKGPEMTDSKMTDRQRRTMRKEGNAHRPIKRSVKKRRGGGKRRKKNRQLEQVEIAASQEPRRPARKAGFYKAGVTISVDGGKKERKRGVEIPPGTSFRAALKVGVSTNFSGATVLAEVLEPVIAGGKVVVPKGSTLKGRIRGSGDRIYLDFNKAVKPGGAKMSLRGYAVSGKLPGVPAKVRQGPGSKDSSRAGSVMANGSLRTAQGMVGTLSGGSVTGQLVRNVAGESLNEVRQDVNTRVERTLELPAGTQFSVIVTD
jgi:hypothetical protein